MAKAILIDGEKDVECPFKPCGWHVVILPDESKKSSIVLPDKSLYSYNPYAKVVAVGDGEYQNGELIPVRQCKVGDRVIVDPRASFCPMDIGNKKYRILASHFVIAVVKGDK